MILSFACDCKDEWTSGPAIPGVHPHSCCSPAEYAEELLAKGDVGMGGELRCAECGGDEGRKKAGLPFVDGRWVSVSSGCVLGVSQRPPDAVLVTEGRIDGLDALPDPTHDGDSH